MLPFNSAIVHDGYAFKRGRRVKTWKRRYFVLDDVGFNYYKNKSKDEKRGGCSLQKLLHVEKTDKIQCPHPGWTLLVVMGHRNLYMQLCSESERHRWYQAIQCILSDTNNKEISHQYIINEKSEEIEENQIHVTIKEIKKEQKNEEEEDEEDEENEEENEKKRIEYAQPNQIIYEIPEGPCLRNYKSAVMNMLPNHMDIVCTAIPSKVQTLEEEEEEKNIECNKEQKKPINFEKEGKKLVKQCRKTDNQIIPEEIIKICLELCKFIDENEIKTPITQQNSIDYCSWINSTTNEIIQSYFDQLYKKWKEYKQIKEEKEYYWINLYILLIIITKKSNKIKKKQKSKLMMSFSSIISNKIHKISKIIINELNLPVNKKTIQPINENNNYPFQIYEKDGLYFQFQTNINFNYISLENNNNFIQKRISQEFRSCKWLHSLLEFTCPSFIIPLHYVVNYWGFRILSFPFIPIFNFLHLFPNQNDHFQSIELNHLLNHVFTSLNIHFNPFDNISSCFHVFLGSDGRYYPNNLSSLCSSEPPAIGYEGCEYYHFFRFEFQLSYENVKLHPTCFYGEFYDEKNSSIYQKQLINALDHLLTVRIPNFVEHLSQSKYKLLLLGSDFLLSYVSKIN